MDNICSNCGEREEDHIDFYKGFGSKGDTCPHRKSMKFVSEGKGE